MNVNLPSIESQLGALVQYIGSSREFCVYGGGADLILHVWGIVSIFIAHMTV